MSFNNIRIGRCKIMGIYKAEIANMRKNIGENIGQKILIKEPVGKRTKPEERVATIQKTYNDYFMVKYENANRVGSYNYTDLFMKTIEVSISNGEEYVPIFIPEVADRKNKLHKLMPEQGQNSMVQKPNIETA